MPRFIPPPLIPISQTQIIITNGYQQFPGPYPGGQVRHVQTVDVRQSVRPEFIEEGPGWPPQAYSNAMPRVQEYPTMYFPVTASANESHTVRSGQRRIEQEVASHMTTPSNPFDPQADLRRRRCRSMGSGLAQSTGSNTNSRSNRQSRQDEPALHTPSSARSSQRSTSTIRASARVDQNMGPGPGYYRQQYSHAGSQSGRRASGDSYLSSAASSTYYSPASSATFQGSEYGDYYEPEDYEEWLPPLANIHISTANLPRRTRNGTPAPSEFYASSNASTFF
ncbi:hypothetical protein CVT24_011239 [Panaeolus cyanescens]|uniref:Uncharacterized protein n=1 Tax=Panaeolus cyanescens TaxID=181874 RepID=A0A409YGL0_9AGAR|nr:hypothetical protein CVT24_011239 [Panaeolus cyanescens]